MFSKKNILSTAIWPFNDAYLNTEEGVIGITKDQNRKKLVDSVLELRPNRNNTGRHVWGRVEDRVSVWSWRTLSSVRCVADTWIFYLPARPNGTVSFGFEAMMMFLKQFSYPCILSDIVPRVGRLIPEMNLILAGVTDFIAETHGHLLRNLDHGFGQRN